MERLTKRCGGNGAVPCNINYDFVLDIDFETYCGVQDIINRLAAYEDTGLEPEEIKAIHAFFNDRSMEEFEHLHELLEAEKDGRLEGLPCKVGDTVFTIEEDYFNCEQCEHGSKAKYELKINRVCCGLNNGWHCPRYIKEHIVEGFEIGADDAGNPSLSAPGEWGYEGLETFSGIDGKWYPSREEAEAALAEKGGKDHA